jgi:hypothetical protein
MKTVANRFSQKSETLKGSLNLFKFFLQMRTLKFLKK